jgi:soluble lytic murein transglycosylase-like protein
MGNVAHATEAEYIDNEELWKIAIEVGDMYDLDSAILVSLVDSESTRNIWAVNGTHKGLTQVTAKWHQERMDRLGVEDLYDPYGSILVCADYLDELLGIGEKKGYGRSIEYALMRYNMATDTANSMYARGEISGYAKKIVKRAAEYQEEKEKWESVYDLEKIMEDMMTRKQATVLAKSIGSGYLLDKIK